MYQCSKLLVSYLTILTFTQIQCLHLMHAELAWVLVSSGTQVQSQIILDIDYIPDYPSVSYDYDFMLETDFKGNMFHTARQNTNFSKPFFFFLSLSFSLSLSLSLLFFFAFAIESRNYVIFSLLSRISLI